MGLAKQFKTGAVVGTYPRPLLVLNFDENGLDVIKEPIVDIPAKEFEGFCKQPTDKLAPLSCVDFRDLQQRLMTIVYQPQAAKEPFANFVDCVNKLVKVGCPWKTVVLDSVSGFSDSILGHVAETNSSALGSALKWAPMIGQKIHQCLSVMTTLPCHVVFICHCTSPTVNETTSEVTVAPIVPSQWMRDRLGSLVSQFFYQVIEGKGAVVYTSNAPYVKGIGCRWPDGLPQKVAADFKSIYGKAGL